MKLLNNQTGSTLNMVLVVVIIIGVFTAPMMMTAGQGSHSAIRAENDECALYMVESALDIMKTALDEAINNEGLSLGEGLENEDGKIGSFIENFNTASAELFSNETLQAQVFSQPTLSYYERGIENPDPEGPDKEKFLKITAVCGEAEKYRMERTITLKLDDWQQGSSESGGISTDFIDPLTGIFGKPGVTSKFHTNKNLEAFKTTDEKAISTDNNTLNGDISSVDYNSQFEAYMDIRQKEQPSSDTSNYNLTAGNTVISGDVNTDVLVDGTITVRPNGEIVIDGDLIASDNIDFNTIGWGNKLIIKGDLITGESLRFNNSSISDLHVEGNIVAKNTIEFPTINKLTVGGSISSDADIKFNGSIDYANITGSI
jgi:type II secretory pathway pseudopilin PulG